MIDTDRGRLDPISEREFLEFLPAGISEPRSGIQRIEHKGTTVFTGDTFPTHTRFPRRVYFQITRNCNLQCAYCYLGAGPGFPQVPTSAALDMATFLARNGLVEVRLTGGEPTSHPAFFDILHRFRLEGVYVSVATNGVMDRTTIERLCHEPNLLLICSVDGGRAIHNRYRPGTFDTIIANLRRLKEINPSIRIRLTTVLTKENKGQMLRLGEVCCQTGAESITVIPLRPQVRMPVMLGQMVTGPEFLKVIEDLIQAREKFGIRFTTTLETDFAPHVEKDPVLRKRSSCAAGREGTNLDFDAERKTFFIYGCSYSPASDLKANPAIRKPFVGGEFPMDDPSQFLRIWRNEAAWTIFRNLAIKSDDCISCSFYKRHSCTGSCPIQNIDYGSIDVESDVLDQYRKQIIRTGEWYCYRKVLRPDGV